MSAATREAGSRPFPDKPVGAINTDMPFDHIVVVMMENHSFDNPSRRFAGRRWVDIR
jgi:phospholipase C